MEWHGCAKQPIKLKAYNYEVKQKFQLARANQESDG